MLDLVQNPEDKFSHDETHMIHVNDGSVSERPLLPMRCRLNGTDSLVKKKVQRNQIILIPICF